MIVFLAIIIIKERDFEGHYSCPSFEDYRNDLNNYKSHAYASYYDYKDFREKNFLGNELSCFCNFLHENRKDIDLSTYVLDS